MKKNKTNKNQTKNRITQLEQAGAQLQLDLDREMVKLDELVKVQKNYENPEKLVNIKSEFNQRNVLKGKHEAEQKRNKKLNDERNGLQERIRLLKNMADKYYREKENNLNEINQKINHKK